MIFSPGFNFIFSMLAKRLTVKTVSDMNSLMSSGMLSLNSVDQSRWTWVSRFPLGLRPHIFWKSIFGVYMGRTSFQSTTESVHWKTLRRTV